MENFIEDLTDKKLEQLEEIRDFQFKPPHMPFVPLKAKIPKTKIFLMNPYKDIKTINKTFKKNHFNRKK